MSHFKPVNRRWILLSSILALGLGHCQPATREAAPTVATPSAAAPAPVAAGDFRNVFTRISRAAIPSVVSIVSERTVRAPQNPFDFFGGVDPFEYFFGGPKGGKQQPSPQAPPKREFHQSGLGSGFIVSAEGHILTNNHVVEGADTLRVQMVDERLFDAVVVGVDKPTDLAVIKLKKKPDEPLRPLRFGDSDKLQIGEWVVAVGAPFGLEESVTTGIISAKGRQNTGISAYGNFLQTDAAINPGNSGGPLMNLDGEVVGINTAIYSQSGGYQGIGFAIPVNLAKHIMDRLIKFGKVTRGWLGVSIQSISPDMADALELPNRKGALVGDVLSGGPADKAGVKRGDVILSIMGAEVRDANDLMNRVALVSPGTVAEIMVLRDGKKLTLKVTIAKRDEASLEQRDGGETGSAGGAADVAAFGLSVADLSDALRQQYGIGGDVRQGAVVVDIDPAGSAARAGLRPGDVITEADRKPVATASALSEILRSTPVGKSVLMLVARNGSTFFAVVKASSKAK